MKNTAPPVVAVRFAPSVSCGRPGGWYRGLLPTRDRDVLGVGWVQSFTVDDPAFTAPYEGVLEAYYRLRVTPWFRLSPMVQFIVNPGSTDTPDALVLGLRGQFVF